jgi:hypothetical protein
MSAMSEAKTAASEHTGKDWQYTLPFDADERKAAGMGRADAGTDDWWKSCVDAGIAELARRGVPFQAVDLLDIGVPEPDHPNRWGPRLSAAARRGVIAPVGYAPSKRPTTSCSVVRIWRGVPPEAGG